MGFLYVYIILKRQTLLININHDQICLQKLQPFQICNAFSTRLYSLNKGLKVLLYCIWNHIKVYGY